MTRRSVVVVAFFCCFSWGQQQRLQVKVDPRIELMSVVEILANYGFTGLLSTDDSAYRRDVDAWFAPYKAHPAVRRFAELAQADFNFDGPVLTFLCLSEPPELMLQAKPEECSAERAGGAPSLMAWLEQLRDFAGKSDFMTFFRAHRGLYSLMEEGTRKKIQKDYAANLEDYFGTAQASYQIILAPLLVGNFGPRMPRPDGRFDLYGVLGSSGQVNGVTQFGSVEVVCYLVWHEFGHSFVNPEIDRLGEAVDKNKKLLDPIAKRMERQAYGTWRAVVYEHVVRAMTTRLSFRELGEEEGRAALLEEKSRGFAYVEALADRLKEYEAHRDRYPTFHDFAPRLIAVFDELAARPLPPGFYAIPYAGSMSSAYVEGEATVVIVPTGEPDPTVQQNIRAYVEKMRQQFYPDAKTLTDEEALQQDLSSFQVLAYGTLAGNKWLARHKDMLPALAALNAMNDPGPLRLIATMPNPQNSQRGATVFTATTGAAVVGIHSLFHGGTAYVIGKGTTVLKAGNYRQQDGRWVLK